MEWVVLLGGYTAGCMSVFLWDQLFKGRLLTRLENIRDVTATTVELENRRVAYDSGREHLARRSAGAPARVADGMATKPGVYARYLRDSDNSKKLDAETG